MPPYAGRDATSDDSSGLCGHYITYWIGNESYGPFLLTIQGSDKGGHYYKLSHPADLAPGMEAATGTWNTAQDGSGMSFDFIETIWLDGNARASEEVIALFNNDVTLYLGEAKSESILTINYIDADSGACIPRILTYTDMIERLGEPTFPLGADIADGRNQGIEIISVESYDAAQDTWVDITSQVDENYTVAIQQYNDDKTFRINCREANPNVSKFNAVLLLDENASVPNATINYSIAPGTGIAAVPGTSMAVLAPSADTGVTGTPTISNAVFAPGDATVTSIEGVTIDAGEKAVVKPISIDFSGVTFAQPGIFRYVISEPSSGNNMTYDTQLNDTTNGTRYQRVLDVYVVRNASDEYEIGGFVLHEVAGAVNEGETTAADKSSGFVNEYNTTGLTLECQVEGNQSSIDKYFAYTITMQNPGNSAFNVAADWSNASGAQNPVANPATSYTNEAIAAANTNEWTSNADGSLSKTIYLKDGQKVALEGIPVGTAYSISVAEEDYGPRWVVKGYSRDTKVDEYDTVAFGTNDATGNRSLGDTEDVIFTLVREGVVPTGVALSILPGVIIMGAAAAFLFVMKNRKREEASEA